jgi:hypothetical protein
MIAATASPSWYRPPAIQYILPLESPKVVHYNGDISGYHQL